MKHVCLTYPDQRSCSVQTTRRWFYNATIRSCVQFDYGGCGGNFNNFLSEKKCQEVCHSGKCFGSFRLKLFYFHLVYANYHICFITSYLCTF